MIQILYTQDHAERAQALAQEVAGSQHGLISIAPTAKAGLNTLVFWGHGTIASLCDLSPDKIVELIAAWKKLNSQIKTVEIITCNSRHFSSTTDAFASKMKAGLSAGFLSSTRNIVVKALPVRVGGGLNAFSILLAHAATKSWCYITGPGPDDTVMMNASKAVKDESKNSNYDLAVAADQLGRTANDRQYTLNYGYFNKLRTQLVVV